MTNVKCNVTISQQKILIPRALTAPPATHWNKKTDIPTEEIFSRIYINQLSCNIQYIRDWNFY